MASPAAIVLPFLLLLGTCLVAATDAQPPNAGDDAFGDPASQPQQQFEVAKQFDKKVLNVAAGDPSSSLWTQRSRRRPVPTNKFWQNFVLNSGSAPEYIHPYSVRSRGGGSIGVGYPSRVVNSKLLAQVHSDDLIVSAWSSEEGSAAGSGRHSVARYDDLSVTLSLLAGKVHAPLMRGSPYTTFIFKHPSVPVLGSNHTILNVSTTTAAGGGDNRSFFKQSVFLSNGQKWAVYSSSPIWFQQQQLQGGSVAGGSAGVALVATAPFQGVIRVALVASDAAEPVLDSFSKRYPTASRVTYAAGASPPSIVYDFHSQGEGELLLLSLPLHRTILVSGLRLAPEVSYASIDGELQGAIGESWRLAPGAAAAGWHSAAGVATNDQLNAALERDVAALRPISTSSTYFFGKAVARAARLAMIAEEVGKPELASTAAEFVKQHLSPWFDGDASGNAIVYDSQWGGLVSQQGAFDSGADFGLGVYNDHHYHWGYFVYAGAVLARLDRAWGEHYRTNLFSLAADYMSLNNAGSTSAFFPRLRHFDPWVLHSWAGGLTEFADGRNQESTSEAVNAYYAASLLGDALGDGGLSSTGALLAALEAHGAKSLWHIPSGGGGIYDAEFSEANRITGVLWSNKRDTNLWFSCGSGAATECKVGIQVIPVTPATQLLFNDVEYSRQLFEWASPSLSQDSWKAFAFAVQATYDPSSATSSVQQLQSFDDGNSLSNMLWWVAAQQSQQRQQPHY